MSRLARCLGAMPAAAFLTGLALVPAVRAAPETQSLNRLVLNSDLIVVGKIVRITEVERPNDLQDISFNHRARYRAIIATIEVDETLKGDPGSTVKFTYPREPRIAGEPVYDPAADGVWLLRKSERPGEYLADDEGRRQPRERKEQVRAILNAAKTQKGESHGDDK